MWNAVCVCVCVWAGAGCLCLWGLSLTSELTDFGSLFWGIPVFASAVPGLQEGCHTHSAFPGSRTPVLTLWLSHLLSPKSGVLCALLFSKERGHNFNQITKGS